MTYDQLAPEQKSYYDMRKGDYGHAKALFFTFPFLPNAEWVDTRDQVERIINWKERLQESKHPLADSPILILEDGVNIRVVDIEDHKEKL